MTEVALMDPSSETDNKLRWQADFNGVKFQLYIPKSRVPRPWPRRIIVVISDRIIVDEVTPVEIPLAQTPSIDLKLPIISVVERVSDHTKTARFAPIGKAKTWEIGEPYIPYTLLPSRDCQRLQVEVRFDDSAGTWSD